MRAPRARANQLAATAAHARGGRKRRAARSGAGRLLYLLFFTSGAIALSAEVVLERLLTYVFGASHLADR